MGSNFLQNDSIWKPSSPSLISCRHRRRWFLHVFKYFLRVLTFVNLIQARPTGNRSSERKVLLARQIITKGGNNNGVRHDLSEPLLLGDLQPHNRGRLRTLWLRFEPKRRRGKSQRKEKESLPSSFTLPSFVRSACCCSLPFPLSLPSPSPSQPRLIALLPAALALSSRRPICPNNDSDSDPIMCGEREDPPSSFLFFLLDPCFSRFGDFCVTLRPTRVVTLKKGQEEEIQKRCRVVTADGWRVRRSA